MPGIIDLTGKRFGRYVVLSLKRDDPRPGAHWLCECDCGNVRVVGGQPLREGASTSCGCYHAEKQREVCAARNRTHGQSGTALYKRWTAMRARVARDKNYASVRICPRWDEFKNFAADMGEPPTSEHTLDRIDVLGDYEPSNCRWATRTVQANNKRNNRVIEAAGRRLPIQEWAREVGAPANRIRDRMRRGWPAEKAIFTREDGRALRWR